MIYATFLRRFNAYGIDATIVFIVAWLIDILLGGSAFAQQGVPDELLHINEMMVALQSGTISPEVKTLVIESITRSFLGGSIIPGPSQYLMGAISALYNILFVAGKWQATPGKHWLGIKVVMKGGRRLTLLESTIRHTVSGITMLPLGLGYMTMFFTRQKLALHDIICNTRVIRVSQIPVEPAP